MCMYGYMTKSYTVNTGYAWYTCTCTLLIILIVLIKLLAQNTPIYDAGTNLKKENGNRKNINLRYKSKNSITSSWRPIKYHILKKK